MQYIKLQAKKPEAKVFLLQASSIEILVLNQPKILLKESFQFINNRLLLFITGTTATKTGNGRHYAIHICAGCFQNTITECVFNKLPCFLRLKLFFSNQCLNVSFPLFSDIPLPISRDICTCIDGSNEILNQFLFRSKLKTGLNCLVNCNENFFILTIAIMVFGY